MVDEYYYNNTKLSTGQVFALLTNVFMKDSDKLEKEVRLRNISDYIFSCIERLSDNASLLFYLGNNKTRFLNKDSKNTIPIIISMVDVYSRDSIVILNTILDKDSRTSSLFTLLKHINNKKIQQQYLIRLKKIKLSMQNVVKGRNTMVAHFNTNLNTIYNDRLHIIVPVEFDPRYIIRISKDIKKIFWDLKEELSIEGVLVFYKGSVVKSFAELIGKKNRININFYGKTTDRKRRKIIGTISRTIRVWG